MFAIIGINVYSTRLFVFYSDFLLLWDLFSFSDHGMHLNFHFFMQTFIYNWHCFLGCVQSPYVVMKQKVSPVSLCPSVMLWHNIPSEKYVKYFSSYRTASSQWNEMFFTPSFGMMEQLEWEEKRILWREGWFCTKLPCVSHGCSPCKIRTYLPHLLTQRKSKKTRWIKVHSGEENWKSALCRGKSNSISFYSWPLSGAFTPTVARVKMRSFQR